MVFGLSTSHEIGLAATGAIFIIFALLSSFVFPRFNPNFPGKKGLRWFIPLCVVFFVAMMSSVLYFGQEQSVAEATPGHPASSGNAANGKAALRELRLRRLPYLHAGRRDGEDRPGPRSARRLREQGRGQPLEDFTTEAIIHPPAKYVPPGSRTRCRRRSGRP